MNKDEYDDIFKYLTTLTYPEKANEQQKSQIRKQSNKYFTTEQHLFKRRKNGQPQRVILPEQTELILFNLHKDLTGAYLGIETTYEKLKERYYWPQMYESVRKYIQHCDTCQRRGKPKRTEEPHPI